jgi:hypothetical protein
MGSNFIQKDTHIGTFQINDKTANLPIDCSQDCRFSMIVQNKDGQPQLEENAQLEAGEQVLTFDLSRLKNGSYDAWIEVDGKTFIRNFTIETGEEDGFFNKMKKLFS